MRKTMLNCLGGLLFLAWGVTALPLFILSGVVTSVGNGIQQVADWLDWLLGDVLMDRIDAAQEEDRMRHAIIGCDDPREPGDTSFDPRFVMDTLPPRMRPVPSIEENPEGFHGKYIIKKADGSPVDPEAEYVVFQIAENGGHDPAHIESGRKAVAAYVQSILSMPDKAPHLQQMARELRHRLDSCGKPMTGRLLYTREWAERVLRKSSHRFHWNFELVLEDTGPVIQHSTGSDSVGLLDVEVETRDDFLHLCRLLRVPVDHSRLEDCT